MDINEGITWLVIIALSTLTASLSWFIKSHLEKLRNIEKKLQEERWKLYAKILEPYIYIFSNIKDQDKIKAFEKTASYDYRKTAFDLNLFGSDEVVHANNALMKYMFEAKPTEEQDSEEKKQYSKELMFLWGNLLLEIRRSLVNKKTKLNERDMLRAMITDIDRL